MNSSYTDMIKGLKSAENESKYRVLTLTEERAMIDKHRGDRATIERLLVQHNMTLVTKFVYKYDTQLDKSDVFQEGLLGLIDASTRFNIDATNKFATYAYHYVRKYISRMYQQSNRQFDGTTNGMVWSLNFGQHKDNGDYTHNMCDKLLSERSDGEFGIETPETTAGDNSETEFNKKIIEKMISKGIISTNEVSVIDGVYYRGETNRMISERMGVSSTMVGTYHKNAIKKMRKYLTCNNHISALRELKVIRNV